MVVSKGRIEKRWRIVVLWESGGYTRAGIAKAVRCSHHAVDRWIRRYEETGSVEDRPRSGRANSLSEQAQIQVCLALEAGDSSYAVAKRFAGQGFRVTPWTIRNIAKRRHLVYRVGKSKPALRRSHKLARLEFARTQRPRNYWKQALYSDEAGFGLYYDPRGRWVVEGQTAGYRPTVKWAVVIRVWAAVSWEGRTKLFRIPKAMTAVEFARFMQDKAVPAMIELAGNPARAWRLVQDGDGAHTAKITLKTLRKLGVRLVSPWPARSPDLNVIENLWSMLGRRLEKHHTTTEAGLWRALKTEWASIPHENIRSCVRSVPRRLHEVIKARGGPTRY